MCHSIDELYSLYENRKARARVAHVCGACREDIRVGDIYHRVATLFDGSWTTYRRCLRCEAIWQHLRAECRPDDYPDELLNCGMTYEDTHIGPPPAEIARLAFISRDEAQAEFAQRTSP